MEAFPEHRRYDVMNEYPWSPEASKSRDAPLKIMQFISEVQSLFSIGENGLIDWVWHWVDMALLHEILWEGPGGHLVMTPHLVFNQCPHV